MTDSHRAMLQMMLCAMLWSIAGVLIKLVPWNAIAIAGVRSLIASFVLLFYLKKARIPLRVTGRSMLVACFLSGIFLSFVLANKLTTAANAIVLQYCAPVLILLYNLLFKHQRPSAADVTVVLFTVAGIALFFLDKLGGGTLIGNLVALLAGVFFAAMFLASDGISEETRLNGIFQGQILTSLVGLPFLFFTHAEITGQSLLIMLALGVFQLGLPYLLYGLAAKNCPPLLCSLLSVLEPLFNPVWVVLFIGERPGALSLAGSAVVLVAVTLWCVYNERRTVHAQPATRP